jgi:Carboxypeptidase regulatory-like domain/TonB dependent receptor
MRLRRMGFLGVVTLVLAGYVSAQSPNGIINGLVLDPSGSIIPGAEIRIANDATGVQYTGKTNDEGIYVVTNLPPGPYRLQVSKIGFKTLIKPDIILNVQDSLAINFTLPVGAASEVVTVTGGAPLMNTESAAVSTVVDRQFAENLPMNGRSFQTLIELTPGVVLTQSIGGSEGQFSVNGQRASSNYWMVDGVSANIGTGAGAGGGNGVGGALGSFSVLGGTNSLVSVDALQEFRIQTSTYAPEFGRTPGGQISIVTRSGADQFHGTVFDYLRNSVLDANNWFADKEGLPKPGEKQNDFGGTFSGPILRSRTFFFFSYEGLRLRLPETTLTSVPDLAARQNASTAVQPFLNAYPLPNGADSPATGVAQSNASYSNPATLDAYSLRVDHKLTSAVSLFGRFNDSPSQLIERAGSSLPLNDVEPITIHTLTATAGVTWALSAFAANDFRFNYSKTEASSYTYLDNFGGATVPTSLPFPSPFSTKNAIFLFGIFGLTQGDLEAGASTRQVQRQINLVDSVSVQKGTHNLKFGVDYRRLSPEFDPFLYIQGSYFSTVPDAQAGSLFFAVVNSARDSRLLLQNLGAYAQDTWRLTPRATLVYGLRWDVDFAPGSLGGASLPAVTGYNLGNLSNLALAPAGTAPFATTFGNFAPRVGLAYVVSQKPDWSSVVRGGFGLFYDLATAQVGETLYPYTYPFGAQNLVYGQAIGGTATFPLSSSDAAPPPITASGLSTPGSILFAFDPHLKLPYTLEWNVAFEQGLGEPQSISASYVGSVGRRLLQTAVLEAPSANLASAALVGNTAASNYNALQIQFQRRLSHGLQTLASYSWSHSIDDGSVGTFGTGGTYVPASNANRGPSDFDIRNAFSAGLTYDIPAPKMNRFVNTLLGGWSIDNFILARSAPPVNVFYSAFADLQGAQTEVRPDVEPGVPLYLHGSQYPGGIAINDTPGAVAGGCPGGSASIGPFCSPPTDSLGNPLRQGNLGRNALRGFGATQWDFAVHRDFPIRDSLKLQFRAELFNVLNHPNFAPPISDLQSPQAVNPQFGLSTQTLGQYLGGANAGNGGFNSLYQLGGPRSIQFALKLMF